MNDILTSILAISGVLLGYVIYLGVILVFLYIVWNIIIVPTLPVIAAIF